MDCREMLDMINSAAKADSDLSGLYDKMLEYSHTYLFIKSRQKGCDGLGELNNLRDEVSAALKEIADYCKGKHLFPESPSYDPVLILEELEKRSVGRTSE